MFQHAEAVPSFGEDMQLDGFVGLTPSLVESCHGGRPDEYVVIGDGKKEGRRIGRHGRRCSIARVNAGGEVRSAPVIVLHRCGHRDSPSGGKARDADPLRIKAPFG